MIVALKTVTKNMRTMFSKRFFQVAILLSLGVLLGSILLILWQLFPAVTEQPAVPLHYNIHFGVDLFGVWWRIFTIPFIGLVIFFVNTLVSLLMWKKEMVLSYMFMSVNMMAQLLLFAGMVFVVLLNLSYYG